MKNLILFLLIPLISFGQESERISFKYFLNSKGLDLSLEIPNNFKRSYFTTQEDKDSWVASYVFEENSIVHTININVKKFPFDPKSWDEINIKKLFEQDYSSSRFSMDLIDSRILNFKGYLIAELLFEKNNKNLFPGETMLQWQFLHQDKLIILVLASSTKEGFNELKNTYLKVLNSFIIN